MKPSHPKRCAPCASRKSSPAEVVALLKKAEELELKNEAQMATKAPGKGVRPNASALRSEGNVPPACVGG